MEVVNDTKNQNISYEAFDFHKECGSMRWDRLSILMDKLDLDQKQFGYFMQVKFMHVKFLYLFTPGW